MFVEFAAEKKAEMKHFLYIVERSKISIPKGDSLT